MDLCFAAGGVESDIVLDMNIDAEVDVCRFRLRLRVPTFEVHSSNTYILEVGAANSTSASIPTIDVSLLLYLCISLRRVKGEEGKGVDMYKEGDVFIGSHKLETHNGRRCRIVNTVIISLVLVY